LVTIAAAEAAAEGKSFDEVMAVATAARDRTFTFAMLERVDFAVRGGRVPAVVGRIARWLRLNVILRTFPDGRVKAGGGLIGNHRRIERFARYVARRAAGTPQTRLRLLVAHANRPEAGRQFQERLLAALPPDIVERCDFTDMGAAIGVHGGPGTIIVAVQRR
jgi:DegV family protein with EDD domain